MKNVIPLLLFSCILLLTACKKNGPTEDYKFVEDSTHILQSLVYKVNVTQPSPFDLANNPPVDSFVINYNRTVGKPDYLENYRGLSFSFGASGTGFGLLLLKDYTNPGSAIFQITPGAVPQVPKDFEINKIYSNTNHNDYLNISTFITIGDGLNGICHYFTDTVPSDAVSVPKVTEYCQVVFTNKNTLHATHLNVPLYDGEVTGYQICSYGISDPNKYLQRWDYTIHFTSIMVTP